MLVINSEQIGAFRRRLDAFRSCWRTAFATGFSLMMALFSLRFLPEELLAGLMTDVALGGVIALGMVSVEGPDVHEADVPLPLSEEVFEGVLGIWSFWRLRLERFEDEVFRFLTLERLGLDSF